MHILVYILRMTILLLVSGLELAMLVRAVLSWFPIDEESVILQILYAITEPVIFPIRALLNRLGWFQDLPIDMSFFLTFILLSVIRMLL